MKNKKLTLSIIALILVLVLGGFLAYGYYQKANFKLQRPVVTMEIKDYGTVKIELYPDVAPNTVKNFIKLINEGYYDGLTFHRVEEYLIQGGQKEDETAKYGIEGEFAENGFENTMKFERGTLGLAREDYTQYYYFYGLDASIVKEGYNSGYAQFFIMTQPFESFDGNYTAFGKVIEGMEIVDTISKLKTEVDVNEETGETSETSSPVDSPVITKMTVDTFGENYGDPKIIERSL